MDASMTMPEHGRSHDVFTSLSSVSATRGVGSIAEQLSDLRAWMDGDMSDVERALKSVGASDETLAHKSGRHLLDLSGKRLRPLCVALAARAGQGFTEAALLFAVAVELVHNATLLHDDVVDLGDRRRGADAARVIYGNAASIFGGDWLLAEALCLIHRSGMPEVMGRMLEVIKEMVTAEALQLERRGEVRTSAEDYFSIVSGKTASLFRWAMFAGARAGQVDGEACRALEGFGQNLGMAFQLVDDVLDFTGDPEKTGKTLLADLREGKMTYPLILAAERSPGLGPVLAELCAGEDVAPALTPEVGARIARVMKEGRVVDDCLALATRYCEQAVESLSPLPHGLAKAALEDVALAAPRRRK
jgi:octaprenyl-diphosphate synthase